MCVVSKTNQCGEIQTEEGDKSGIFINMYKI